MHEILLRGLIWVFGAVFPCVCLEAKVSDGPGNGVFGGAPWSRAVSTAAAAAGPGARPRGSSESRSGAKPGEEKALDTLGCPAGPGARGLYIT